MKKVEIEVRGRKLTLETGKLAKQADGAVVAQYGDTVVLATAVSDKVPKEGLDFFPLTVDYLEKAYSKSRKKDWIFSRSPLTIRKRHTPQAKSPAGFSKEKEDRPRKKSSPRVLSTGRSGRSFQRDFIMKPSVL